MGGVPAVFLFQFTEEGELARGIIYPQTPDVLAPYYKWVDEMERVSGPADNRDKVTTSDKELLRKYRAGDVAATEAMVRAGLVELRRVWGSSLSYSEVKAFLRDGKVNVGTVAYSKERIDRLKDEISK